MLEPIHMVEIRIPEDCMGKVMGDLSSRRGKIQGMDLKAAPNDQSPRARQRTLPLLKHS